MNERLAYNFLGKLRQILIFFFDSFLDYQVKKIRYFIRENQSQITNNLSDIIPEIDTESLKNQITDKESSAILEIANTVLKHEFTILNSTVRFEDAINWHLDFNSNFEWDKGRLYSNYNQVDQSNNADVKFPRELSRCHHFLQLGQAYLISKNDIYANEFRYQVLDWIKENPYKKSINWGCSMDIAIRASNWIYGLQMMKTSTVIDDQFLIEIYTSLYLHGRYIYENPEKNRVYNHNHYLSDLAGQILISLLFKNLNSSEVSLWLKNGVYEFFREIRLQILPSGFTYERTTNYHRLVLELIAYTIIHLRANNVEIPQDITHRINTMFESTMNYVLPNGEAPIIGDQDNGRFLPFFPYEINYQRYFLTIGSVLFNSKTYKSYAGKSYIDLLFLFGNEGIHIFDSLESQNQVLTSKAFSDAGFYLMKTDRTYLFINNSGLSHYNENEGGTHTHSDLLSFVYAYNGRQFLIDPGTYVYSSNPKERMKFRSTAMHNTITVDDFSQNSLNENELWSIKRDAIPKELLWESTKEMDVFEGSHSGYLRLKDPVTHQRRFELDKKFDILKITDTIIGSQVHKIKCHFHFDEGVTVALVDNTVYCRSGVEKIEMNFESDTEYTVHLQDEFISKSYNSKYLAPYLIVSFNVKSKAKFITEIKTTNYDF